MFTKIKNQIARIDAVLCDMDFQIRKIKLKIDMDVNKFRVITGLGNEVIVSADTFNICKDGVTFYNGWGLDSRSVAFYPHPVTVEKI